VWWILFSICCQCWLWVGVETEDLRLRNEVLMWACGILHGAHNGAFYLLNVIQMRVTGLLTPCRVESVPSGGDPKERVRTVLQLRL